MASTPQIILMGAGSVGKSALAQKYMNNSFYNDYEPTIEDTHQKTVEINGKETSVEIVDTAGTEQFKSVYQTYYSIGNGFLVIFSIVDKASFDYAVDVIREISERRERVPIFLVGNKNDLTEGIKVTREEINNVTGKYNCNYYNTSARTGENVTEVRISVTLDVQEYGPGYEGADGAEETLQYCLTLN